MSVLLSDASQFASRSTNVILGQHPLITKWNGSGKVCECLEGDGI